MTWLIGLVLRTVLPSVIGKLADDAFQEIAKLFHDEKLKREGRAEVANEDTAAVAKAETAMAKAEANADRTRDGLIEASRKGTF